MASPDYWPFAYDEDHGPPIYSFDEQYEKYKQSATYRTMQEWLSQKPSQLNNAELRP